MAAWIAIVDGREVVLEEHCLGTFKTEAQAHAAAVERGGVLRAQKVQGALYTGNMRVAPTGFMAGFSLFGVRERRK